MKNKIIYLFMVLFLVSCGSSTTSSLAPDSPKGVSSPKVTVQSILSNMEQGRYKQGELLVRFKSGVLGASFLRTNQAVGAKTIKRYSAVPNLEHVKLPEGVSVRDAITKYMSDPNVEYAEPNFIRRAANVPNDRLFDPQQWALQNKGTFADGVVGADIKAPGAWDITVGSDGIIIAVLDTGIDLNHPDLAGNIWHNPGETSCVDLVDNESNGFIDDCTGWDFTTCAEFAVDGSCVIPKEQNNNPADDNGHGSHVSGIIGAVGNTDGTGIAGVMWTVKLLPLKVLNSFGEGSVSDVIDAIEYVVTNVNKGVNIKAINASFGSTGFSSAEKDAIDNLRTAVNDAGSAGVLFVASAGNAPSINDTGTNDDITPVFPASYSNPTFGGLSNIISVAATDQQDRLASFSNYGMNSVQVAAPGVYILSSVPHGFAFSLCTGSEFVGYDFCSGTSMAAPLVTGLVGLLYSFYDGTHDTRFSPAQVRGTILRYVDTVFNDPDSPNLQSLNGKIQSGGRINAFKAVSSLLIPTDLVATAQSSTQISLTWTDRATGEDGYYVERMPLGGSFVRIATLAPNATTFTDSGLSASTTYTYQVKAFNSIAESLPSAPPQSATTLAPDDPPSSDGGGGGCSIGARQNAPTAMADLGVLLMPLLLIAILRRRR